MKYVVAVVDVKKGIMESIKRAIDLINWRPDGKSLLIKPNMITSKSG